MILKNKIGIGEKIKRSAIRERGREQVRRTVYVRAVPSPSIFFSRVMIDGLYFIIINYAISRLFQGQTGFVLFFVFLHLSLIL